MTPHRVLFISGIDTDAGKTYATAWLAQQIAAEGRSVITQKFIQTGCTEQSEDIEAHRRLCGMELQPVDLDHTTAPIIFSYPASAQLAARIDGREIDLGLVDAATERLLGLYDCVLLEGAGGLMVPVTDDVCTIDYVATRQLPVVLVTNGRLGSINHTVLSLEAIAHRCLELAAVVYNHHFDSDPVIAADTRAYLSRYLSRHFPATPLLDLPTLN